MSNPKLAANTKESPSAHKVASQEALFCTGK